MPHALHLVLSESGEAKSAMFAHDCNKSKECTLDGWIDEWITNLIRADNEYKNCQMILVGIGKTVQLLRIRRDFQPVDSDIKAEIVKAYRNATNRVIILDNKVTAP
jgi:hypothetical protein